MGPAQAVVSATIEADLRFARAQLARRVAERVSALAGILIGEAAAAGRIGSGQARAITGVLRSLEDRLDEGQRRDAELKLVELAGRMDADRLAKAAGQVLTEVVPEDADELLERKLQAEAESAHRNRSLRFLRDGGGAVRFAGLLPRVDAEAWLALLDAHAESTTMPWSSRPGTRLGTSGRSGSRGTDCRR